MATNPIAQALSPFIWGRGGAALTPEQVAREREVAEALMAQGIDTSPVGDWTQGAARMANVLAGKIREGRASSAETAGRESQNALRAGLDFSNLFGGGSMAAGSPALGGSPATSTAMATAPAPDIATARVAQAHGGGWDGQDLRSGIIATAEAIGADPIDLATAISYETAGTFDPTKRGPTTQWGQHRGLIQFGEPQARQYGVDWNDPIGSQLGPDGAVANYFRSSGFKPGMSGLDLYSTINAGSPGRYGASDANNGGAPGNVRDKWENQMAGHRQKAMSLLGDYAPSGAVAANEAMASGELANPSLTPDAIQQWAAQNYAPEQAAGVTEAAMAASPGAQSRLPQAAPPLPEPTMVQDMPVADVARALTGATVNPDLPMAGNTSGFLPIAQSLAAQSQGGGMPPMQQIMELASSPWATDMDRQIAGALIKQQMEQADPYNQARLEKLRLEADQLRTGTPGASSSFGNLDAQARAAGLAPGTPQYQEFMLNGGGAPATFRALDMQARAAGFTPGTPEYNEFMATRGAGLQAGAAQTAKNVADIETGGAAAGAVDLGKASIKAGTEAWSDYGKLQTSIGNMDEAIAALDNGAQTGIIYKMLPNITEASASLQNAMDRMGLDVIGSVTFGALSEGEMRLAMQTAAPRDLPPAELRNWLAKKRDAQIKAADMLADAAQFLTKPGNTINDWIERNRSAQKAQGGAGQSSTGIQWSIED